MFVGDLNPVMHYPALRRSESLKTIVQVGHASNGTDAEHVMCPVRTIWVVWGVFSRTYPVINKIPPSVGLKSVEPRYWICREAFITFIRREVVTEIGLPGYSRVLRVAVARNELAQRAAGAPCCRNHMATGTGRPIHVCIQPSA